MTSTFGSSPNAATGGFGQQQQFSATGYGSSSTTNTGFGSSNSGFGASNASAATGFGTSSSGFSSQPSNTNTNPSGFGGGGGYGNSNNFNNNASNLGSGFGNTGTSGFGSNNNPPFGSQQQPSQGGFNTTTNNNMAPINPFGGAPAAPAPPVSFGASANVVTNNNTSVGGFGSSSGGFGNSSVGDSGGFGNSSAGVGGGFGNLSSSENFGSSSNNNNMPGFANSTSSSGWGASASAPTPSFGSNPFGATASNNNYSNSSTTQDYGTYHQSDGDNDMADASTSAFGQPRFLAHSGGMGGSGSGTLTPVYEEAQMSSASPVPTNDPFSGGGGKSDESRLKAQIEEKKRLLAEKKQKLMERKQRKADKEQSSSSSSSSLNVGATPFVPQPAADASLAERNALRFAKNSGGSSPTPDQLPSDFRKKMERGGGAVETSTTVKDRGDREDFENAVSLVGTCQYMCPDDELLRREQEGDIQLLETPQPGTLHPRNWTMRETVVKVRMYLFYSITYFSTRWVQIESKYANHSIAQLLFFVFVKALSEISSRFQIGCARMGPTS
jgi:hypothetical protein